MDIASHWWRAADLVRKELGGWAGVRGETGLRRDHIQTSFPQCAWTAQDGGGEGSPLEGPWVWASLLTEAFS